MTNLHRQRLYQWLLAGMVFTLPTNLFFKLSEDSGYIVGLLIDYLLPKVYLSDLFIAGLLFLWLGTEVRWLVIWQRFQKWWHHRTVPQRLVSYLTLVLVIVFGTRQFLTANVIASAWQLAKLGEMLLLGGFLLSHRRLLKTSLITIAIIAALVFQTSLAWYQFQTQHALTGYWLLGEPQLDFSLTVAKGVFQGTEKILPYGTTAHPNLLAGFMVIYWLLLANHFVSSSGVKRLGIIGLGLTTASILWLTQSWSAGIALLLGLFILLQRLGPWVLGLKIAAFTLSPLMLEVLAFGLTNPSINRRIVLNQAAVQMFTEFPILGVGLNNFTVWLEKYARSVEPVRFVQPAHHLGLLWTAETGIVGILLLLLAIWHFWHLTRKQTRDIAEVSAKLLVLLPLMSFDHYLLTLQTGLLLLVVWLSWPLTLPAKLKRQNLEDNAVTELANIIAD